MYLVYVQPLAKDQKARNDACQATMVLTALPYDQGQGIKWRYCSYMCLDSVDYLCIVVVFVLSLTISISTVFSTDNVTHLVTDTS